MLHAFVRSKSFLVTVVIVASAFPSFFKIVDAGTLVITDLIDLNAVADFTILLCDEIYTLAESRVSSARINRFMSYVNFQSRKLGRHIIYTSQLTSAVDLRFTELTHLPILAQSRLGLPVDTPFSYVFFVGEREVNWFISYEFARDRLFNWYDDEEVVAPFGLVDMIAELEKDNPAKLNSRVNGIVEFLMDKYDWGYIDRSLVEDRMLEHCLPLVVSRFVFNRLKTRSKSLRLKK